MSGDPIYSASVVSTGLAGYPSVYYDRVAVETLRNNLFLYPACDLKQMPDKSGVNMQIFGYTALAADTTAATEGEPGTGTALTQVDSQLPLANYVQYITYSNVVTLTAISDVVAEGSAELAYSGAYSVDVVISTELDTIANSNTASRMDLLAGTYLSAAVSRQAAMSLRSVNVKPKANGRFYGVVSSLSAFDLINDSATGGFLDLEKFSLMGKGADGSQNAGIEATNMIGSVGGVDWHESNALPTEANWESSTHTAYHAYVIGKDGVIASSLGKTSLGQRNFSVKVAKFDQPNNKAMSAVAGR